jgi:hypothetical protein
VSALLHVLVKTIAFNFVCVLQKRIQTECVSLLSAVMVCIYLRIYSSLSLSVCNGIVLVSDVCGLFYLSVLAVGRIHSISGR